MIFYIYRLYNLSNGKCYIGYANNVYSRWKRHIRNINAKDKQHLYICRAINKYGFMNFGIEILEACTTNVNNREQYWISVFNSNKRQFGYNLTKGGDGAPGMKLSDAAKLKISKKAKERYQDPKYRRKMSEARKGKCCGEDHPMFGKHHSIESRQKISAACSGEKHGRAKLSEEQVRQMRSQYLIGIYSTRKLAKIYNISKSSVFSIISNKNWSNGES